MADQSRRAWGWHCLDDTWAARVVADVAVRPGELILDIGAGHGAITRPLVKAGARVLAIELHDGRAERLRAAFPADRVTVVRTDARGLQLPHRPFRVVASPPWIITADLLRILLARGSRLTTADLVLQRAAAHRYAVNPPRGWAMRVGRAVPRRAFRPPPLVDAAVLHIERGQPVRGAR